MADQSIKSQHDLGEAFFEQAAGPAQSPPPPPPPPAPPPPPPPTEGTPSVEYGESFFEEAAGGSTGGSSSAATAQGQPQAANANSAQPSSATSWPLGSPMGMMDPGGAMDTPEDTQLEARGLEGLGLGVAKGLYATKDFFSTGMGLWSDTPAESQRSAPRQLVDAESARLTSQYGEPYSLTEGLAQGAVGLIGAGKAKALGWLGEMALTSARTTAAFEPHAQNLMNLAQAVPGMDGPLAHFLASDPGDSAFTGYLKNALTSIGVEGAALSLFTGTAAALRAMRSGDSAAIETASADLEKALAEHVAEKAASGGLKVEGGGGAEPAATQEPPRPATTYAANNTGLTPANGADSVISEALPSFPPSTPGTVTNASARAPEPLSVDTAALERILNGWSADEQALIKYGSWEAAIADGHTFGGEDRIPWQVLAGSGDGQGPATSMDAFMTRVSAGYASLSDDLKGGAVQTDAANLQAVERRAQLWNEDRATLLGALTAAGERAGSLRADMQAAFAIAQRCMQDTWALASRINIGDFSEFGGNRAAAMAALKQQTGIAATLLASAQSIRSNSARAMRGLRSEFKLDPTMVRNLASLEGDALVSTLTATKGDPVALKAALQPGLLQKLADGAQLILVNNLVSNPLTHAIIFGSNTWQALARPAMRAAGSTVNGSFDTVGREALKSYYFMASSFPDAFKAARDAFKAGDSIIAPHNLAAESLSGGAQASTNLGQKIAQAQFGAWDSPGGILQNTLLAGLKTWSFPTRFVGFQDELVKQVVYRGKVQAKALVEGAAQGLTGDDLAQYVKGKLYDGFDSFGRATDGEALQEAKTATFQNDLNPTGHFAGVSYATQGYAIQRYLQNNPLGRILIPFLRTPVNLYRQGIQLTPGLNLLQAEYRDAITGAAREGETAQLVAQRQAQAMGQMGMGTLIMGTAATLAYQGLITGNAPVDPKLAREAGQDGWKPNSIVIAHRDGSKTYVPFDRFDPVMMPFAIAADIVNVLKSDAPADQNKGESMAAALSLALWKALTEKLYLENISRTIDFALDPEKHGGAYLGGMAANYIPGSSLLHAVNPDPVWREAHDFAGAMLAKVPGLSQDFPARRDWAGDPITVHRGLWYSTPADKANAEIERLALEQGASVGAPGSKAKGGADLRDITLAGNADPSTKGMNAYDRFQELAGHPERMPGAPTNAMSLRQAVTALIGSPTYQRMPDGDASTHGTKLATLMALINGYREGARKFMAADNNVRAAEYAETMRVAKANGYVTPNMPTSANNADGFLHTLRNTFGF